MSKIYTPGKGYTAVSTSSCPKQYQTCTTNLANMTKSNTECISERDKYKTDSTTCATNLANMTTSNTSCITERDKCKTDLTNMTKLNETCQKTLQGNSATTSSPELTECNAKLTDCNTQLQNYKDNASALSNKTNLIVGQLDECEARASKLQNDNNTLNQKLLECTNNTCSTELTTTKTALNTCKSELVTANTKITELSSQQTTPTNISQIKYDPAQQNTFVKNIYEYTKNMFDKVILGPNIDTTDTPTEKQEIHSSYYMWNSSSILNTSNGFSYKIANFNEDFKLPFDAHVFSPNTNVYEISNSHNDLKEKQTANATKYTSNSVLQNAEKLSDDTCSSSNGQDCFIRGRHMSIKFANNNPEITTYMTMGSIPISTDKYLSDICRLGSKDKTTNKYPIICKTKITGDIFTEDVTIGYTNLYVSTIYDRTVGMVRSLPLRICKRDFDPVDGKLSPLMCLTLVPSKNDPTKYASSRYNTKIDDWNLQELTNLNFRNGGPAY